MKRTIIDASQLELNDKVVAIKRVSKTVKGGRTMRFSALVVVGDGNGHVGAGLGKAGEVPEAIRKGKEAAMKNLVEIPMDENKSIPHDFLGEYGSASVLAKEVVRDALVLIHRDLYKVLHSSFFTFTDSFRNLTCFTKACAYVTIAVSYYYQSGKSHGTSTFNSLGYALNGNNFVI